MELVSRFKQNSLVRAGKTTHEKTLVGEYDFSGYGKAKLQPYRLQAPLVYRTLGLACVPLAAPVSTSGLLIAGVQATSTMLSCTCYRKEKYLFSDMSLLY